MRCSVSDAWSTHSGDVNPGLITPTLGRAAARTDEIAVRTAKAVNANFIVVSLVGCL